jgi:RNA polymerase sigma-70 factor (ECF subfamily)
VLAATARVTRDLDTAEECVQDAYAQALLHWAEQGIPRRPAAWLTTVARRRALDLLRRERGLRARLPLLVVDDEPPDADPVGEAVTSATDDIPDDRLRLVFTCCHPALDPDARVALTLRLVCGLSTADVARALLVAEPAMAARITRAKKKIAGARIPFRVPSGGELPRRLDAVLDVVHLVFTTGYAAPHGEDLQRRELVERALHLARILHGLLPDEPGASGLLALILLTDARRDTRTDAEGRLVVLADQDRARWDRREAAEGLGLLADALRHRPPGRYPLMAAIAAVHTQAPTWADTDWRRIARLYDQLLATWPSPVVALNRAVALGEAEGPEVGLVELDVLRGERQLAGYHYLPAARAEFLRRLGRGEEARAALEEAIALAGNDVERSHLEERLAVL